VMHAFHTSMRQWAGHCCVWNHPSGRIGWLTGLAAIREKETRARPSATPFRCYVRNVGGKGRCVLLDSTSKIVHCILYALSKVREAYELGVGIPFSCKYPTAPPPQHDLSTTSTNVIAPDRTTRRVEWVLWV